MTKKQVNELLRLWEKMKRTLPNNSLSLNVHKANREIMEEDERFTVGNMDVAYILKEESENSFPNLTIFVE